ncbi:Chromobox protein-like 8, partial [Ophiophagus hannah]
MISLPLFRDNVLRDGRRSPCENDMRVRGGIWVRERGANTWEWGSPCRRELIHAYATRLIAPHTHTQTHKGTSIPLQPPPFIRTWRTFLSPSPSLPLSPSLSLSLFLFLSLPLCLSLSLPLLSLSLHLWGMAGEFWELKSSRLKLAKVGDTSVKMHCGERPQGQSESNVASRAKASTGLSLPPDKPAQSRGHPFTRPEKARANQGPLPHLSLFQGQAWERGEGFPVVLNGLYNITPSTRPGETPRQMNASPPHTHTHAHNTPPHTHTQSRLSLNKAGEDLLGCFLSFLPRRWAWIRKGKRFLGWSLTGPLSPRKLGVGKERGKRRGRERERKRERERRRERQREEGRG